MKQAIAALLVAAACAPLPGLAQGVQPVNDPAQVARQKEVLVRRLLTDSPVATRIARSDNAEAKRLFASARQMHEKALAALQARDVAGADQQLNEAMWNLGKARQLVPDTMTRVIELRVRYQRLIEGAQSLRGAYARHLGRARGAPPGTPVEDAELQRVDALVEEAKSFANTDQVEESVRAAEKAEGVVMYALNRLLGAATLDYAEKFETQQEEFAYELDRNRSYQELVPIAVSELQPSADARRLVERYVEQNRALRDKAQQAANAKDYKGALAQIRQGTGTLQRALLAAGLVMPREAPSE